MVDSRTQRTIDYLRDLYPETEDMSDEQLIEIIEALDDLSHTEKHSHSDKDSLTEKDYLW